MPGVRTFNVWLDGQKAHLLQQTRKRQMRRARRKSVEATSTIMVAVWPIPISPPIPIRPPAKYCQMIWFHIWSSIMDSILNLILYIIRSKFSCLTFNVSLCHLACLTSKFCFLNKLKVYLCICQYCRPRSRPDPDTYLPRALVLEKPPWFSSSFHCCKVRCIHPTTSTHQPCSQLEIYFSEIFKMIVLNIQYGFWSWRFEYNGFGDVVSM